MAQISPKTQDTVLELKGKFGGNLKKAIETKKSATKQDNFSFVGKAKIVKDVKNTSTKIAELTQGNELLDNLLKIYKFIKKGYEEDKIRREEESNFYESNQLRADKKHKELLQAIETMKKSMMTMAVATVPTPKSDDSGSGFSLPSFLPRFGGTKPTVPAKTPGKTDSSKPNIPDAAKKQDKAPDKKPGKITEGVDKRGRKYYKDEKGLFTKPTATKVSKASMAAKKLSGFFKGLPGIALVVGAASMIYEIDKAIDERDAGEIDDKELHKRIAQEIGKVMGGVGGAQLGALAAAPFGGITAIAGGIAGGFGGAYLGEKLAESLMDYFEKGKDPSAKPEMPMRGRGALNQTPEVRVPSRSFTPKETPNKGQQLTAATNQNVSAKIESSPATTPQVVNTTKTTTTPPRQVQDYKRVSIPAVRNQEETYARLTRYSTRVV